MNLFTFDKEELLKLRKDLLENPEKYERMFTQSNLKYEGRSIFEDKVKRKEEYEYWYRVFNGGYAPIDSLKYHKEMILYSEFVQNVEENALNTLKMTVQRLLQDFEN